MFISRVIVFAILFTILFGIIILYGLLGLFCIFLLFSAIWKFLKKDNWKGIILALNCTNLQKKISRRKRKIFVFIFGYFYACDVIRFPDYQLISRQISQRFSYSHKTIVSHLNSFRSGQFVKLSFSFEMSGVYIFSWGIRPRYEWFQTQTLVIRIYRAGRQRDI